ncbi:MAG TPA: zf-HC2 domain-containing protein [Candidatus Dormibacteraeota bacterium]|nr:zf-HC2 domain-containing protein [Candidatus Dormibacteraeota bacterium]
MTNCEWREKIGLYVDGELEPGAEQAITGHLQNCGDCSAAVLEQQELKKAVRVAGKRFTAPPELYASIQRQMMPKGRLGWWFQGSALAASAVLLALFAFALLSRPSTSGATVAQLIDQHVTMLASANPVDVISTDKHVVKPWFQGKLPFTFNPPELAKDSPFTLIGGRLTYAQHAPGAELVYQVRQHKMSVFIFQARDVSGEPSAGNQAFVVNGWQQGGLQYYIVTDAAREDADRLRALLQDANRS